MTANVPVLCEFERSDLAGTLVDLSRSGAHVKAATDRVPKVGAHVRLVIARDRDRQIEVEARVARHTEQGFGAQFMGTPIELLELLADLGG